MARKTKIIPFDIGERVRLTDKILHKEFAGQSGVVKKVVKSRGVVTVVLESGEMYDAYPENIEKEVEEIENAH